MNNDKLYKSLEHTGVLKMKWGRRNYQNADGSLTPLGKQHLHDQRVARGVIKGDRESSKKENQSVDHDKIHSYQDPVSRQKALNKKMSTMSNDDLRNAVERMKLEETYKDYINKKYPTRPTKEQVKKENKAVRKKRISNALGKSTDKVLSQLSDKMFEYGTNKALESAGIDARVNLSSKKKKDDKEDDK